MTVKEIGPASATGRAFLPTYKATVYMAKAKRAVTATQLDPLAHNILGSLLTDFVEKKLGADQLENGYGGFSLPLLAELHGGNAHATKVDFDLALKQLEEGDFIKTGPKVPYENEPDSDLYFIALVSKREYACLTEIGYRAARNSKAGFERY